MALFENFPYTNIHELNLDWIVKIAKDFLEQYTHIQQLITDGETSLINLKETGLAELQEKADNLEAALQAWYDTHSEDIANQLADALEDLNAWYTQHEGYLDQYVADSIQSFNTAADQKAAQTIASIPADYTSLSNDVNHLQRDLIATGKNSYMSPAVTESTIFPKQYDHVNQNGVDIYTDESGAIHIAGTVGARPLLAFPLSENVTASNLKVYFRIYNAGNTATDDGNVGIYNGSTAFGAHVFPEPGQTVEWEGSYSGTSATLFVYIYAKEGATINAVISFATVRYDNKFLVAPYTKMLHGNRFYKRNGALALVGSGDMNFILDTEMSYDRFWSMPLVYHLSVDNIDYENGVISLPEVVAISPHAYNVISPRTVNYPVNDLIQYFVYNKTTDTITIYDRSYDGQDILLFAIYDKKLISPYTYMYEKPMLMNQFTIKGEVAADSIYIDSTEGTVTINTAIILIGNNYINLGNTYTTELDFNHLYANYYYYNGTGIDVTAENPNSGITLGKQSGKIPLFYVWNRKVFGLSDHVKLYLDGVLIHGEVDAIGLDEGLPAQKIAFLGDSITEGTGAGGNNGAYPKWIADKLGCVTVNCGLHGSAITVTSGQSVRGFIERVTDIPTDCTIVAFMGGTNDYWQNVPLGQDGDNTSATLYGALKLLCEALQTRLPKAFIYAVTPPMGWQPDNNFDMTAKSNIGSFEDVNTAIKTVCKKYSIPVLDMMHDASLNPKVNATKTEYYSDGVHLNQKGEKCLASMHIGFLRTHYRMIW